MWVWTIAAGTILAVASFFFALAESSLFAITRWQLHLMEEASPRPAKALNRLLRQPRDLLGTIVLGSTISNAGLIGITLWTAFSLGWPTEAKFLAVVVLFAITLIFCEVIPKTMGVRAPEVWSLRILRPMLLFKRLLGSVQGIAQGFNGYMLKKITPLTGLQRTEVSDADYRELLEMAYQQGAIAEAEKGIILQIIRLDQITVAEVMKPRSHMICISDEMEAEEMVKVARQHRHRRLPIYDEDPDTIVGILNTRQLLLHPEGDLEEAVELPSFVPEDMNLLQLLRSLQRQQRGMAIVLDEFGGTAGLVTTEDILEELIGEVRGEGEKQEFLIEKLGPGKWRVNGAMRVEEFAREYPGLGEVEEVDTMAGLLLMSLGVIPQTGGSVKFRGLRLTATARDNRRVRELLVERLDGKGTA